MKNRMLDEISLYVRAELDSVSGIPSDIVQDLIILASQFARGVQMSISNGDSTLRSVLSSMRSELASHPVLMHSGMPQHAINRCVGVLERAILMLMGNVQ